MSLSDEITEDKDIRYAISVYKVKEAIKELKERVLWGKNHGNGDLNSTKAVLEIIEKVFGKELTSHKVNKEKLDE